MVGKVAKIDRSRSEKYPSKGSPPYKQTREEIEAREASMRYNRRFLVAIKEEVDRIEKLVKEKHKMPHLMTLMRSPWTRYQTQTLLKAWMSIISSWLTYIGTTNPSYPK
jgi:hypothetical protein